MKDLAGLERRAERPMEQSKVKLRLCDVLEAGDSTPPY